MKLLKKSAAKYSENQDWLKQDKKGMLLERNNIQTSETAPVKQEISEMTNGNLTDFNIKQDLEKVEDMGKIHSREFVKQSSNEYTEHQIDVQNYNNEEGIKFKERHTAKSLNPDNVKLYRRRDSLNAIQTFSLEEDEILKDAMDTFGKNISIRNLAKQLQRS